ITPSDADYRSPLLLGSERRCVLTTSGHVQSILNPPCNTKANYVANSTLSSDTRAWNYAAQHQEGSWWPNWQKTSEDHSCSERDARVGLR
ncbi:class II poly(R)-hydroxyalkanoic acid synthase, partial [Pseudomonas syringae pv. tagetis]